MAKRMCYTRRLAEERREPRPDPWMFARRVRREPVIPQIGEPEMVAAAGWLAGVTRMGRDAPPGYARQHYLDAMRPVAESANREAVASGEPRQIGFADAVAGGIHLGTAMITIRPGRCYGYLPNDSVAAFVWPAEVEREYRARHGWPR
jgi:hypothetical protein